MSDVASDAASDHGSVESVLDQGVGDVSEWSSDASSDESDPDESGGDDSSDEGDDAPVPKRVGGRCI